MFKMMMNKFLGFIIFSLFIGFVSSSTYISDAVFESESHGSIGRSLLQAQKNCPVDFENQNYTVLTSQCKGPLYSADVCCKAFKEFACPFLDEVNDRSTKCADTMFSYINIYGSYPPGTFANLCKEGKHGLECTDVDVPTNSNSKKNSAQATSIQSPMSVILASFLVFLFHLL